MQPLHLFVKPGEREAYYKAYFEEAMLTPPEGVREMLTHPTLFELYEPPIPSLSLTQQERDILRPTIPGERVKTYLDLLHHAYTRLEQILESSSQPSLELRVALPSASMPRAYRVDDTRVLKHGFLFDGMLGVLIHTTHEAYGLLPAFIVSYLLTPDRLILVQAQGLTPRVYTPAPCGAGNHAIPLLGMQGCYEVHETLTPARGLKWKPIIRKVSFALAEALSLPLNVIRGDAHPSARRNIQTEETLFIQRRYDSLARMLKLTHHNGPVWGENGNARVGKRAHHLSR